MYAGQPVGWLALAIASLALLGAFPAMHEAGHSTAFANPRLNDIVVTVGAFLMLQAPSFFREFHWQHHRKTQDPKLDPEIARCARAARRLAHQPLHVPRARVGPKCC